MIFTDMSSFDLYISHIPKLWRCQSGIKRLGGGGGGGDVCKDRGLLGDRRYLRKNRERAR